MVAATAPDVPPKKFGLLSDISSVRIVVDVDRQPDAQLCGVTADSIEAAIRLPASNTKLQVDSQANVLLAASVNVVQGPDGTCAASISLSAIRLVSIHPDAPSRQMAEVWDKSYILLGRQAEFGRAASNKIEDYTKQFISAWLADQ